MLGFEGFDLAVMGNRSHIRPEQIRGDIAGWAQRLGSRVRERGLELADVFLIPWTDFETLAPNHPDASERADARALFADVLELAARMDAPGVTLLPGVEWPDRPHEESFSARPTSCSGAPSAPPPPACAARSSRTSARSSRRRRPCWSCWSWRPRWS